MQTAEIKKKLEDVFDNRQASVLSEVITDAYSDLVKTSDFNELKGIVKDLAEAQKRTEVKMGELSEAQKRTEVKMGELSEAQKRTEVKMGELSEAQKRTEVKVGELADEMKVLAIGLDNTRGDVGGLSRSVSYALENEVYRMIPKLLKDRCGIDLDERLIRADIGGKEINIFGRGKKNGGELLIVGEVKLRLDERRKKKRDDVFKELDEKVEAVLSEYEGEKVLRVLVTHYATKGFLKKAKEKDVVVIQSFEW